MLLALGDLGLQLADVFLEGGDLAVERLVAVASVLEFAGGEQVVGLGGGEESLGVAEMFACLAESVHGGLEGGEGAFADKGEMGDLIAQSGHLTLKRGDLGAAHQRGSGGLAGGSAVGDAVASEELAGAGGKGEAGIGFLESEGGLEIGHDRHSLEEAGDESVGGARRANDVGGPADRSFGKHACLLCRNRKQVAGQDRSASLGGLAQGLEGCLGHARIGEDNGAACRPEGCLDGGDLRGWYLDQRGERAEDPGLVELGSVESAQDGLRSLA